MKAASKVSTFSVALRDFLLCSMTLVLASCVDLPIPFSGEPDESVTEAARPMGHPSNYGADEWPNLADVPDQPPAFDPPKAWQEMREDLEGDSHDSALTRARMEATAPARAPTMIQGKK